MGCGINFREPSPPPGPKETPKLESEGLGSILAVPARAEGSEPQPPYLQDRPKDSGRTGRGHLGS